MFVIYIFIDNWKIFVVHGMKSKDSWCSFKALRNNFSNQIEETFLLTCGSVFEQIVEILWKYNWYIIYPDILRSNIFCREGSPENHLCNKWRFRILNIKSSSSGLLIPLSTISTSHLASSEFWKVSNRFITRMNDFYFLSICLCHGWTNSVNWRRNLMTKGCTKLCHEFNIIYSWKSLYYE